MAAYPLRAAFGGVLLFAIGVAIAGGTLQVNRQERDRLREWQRADGTVVQVLDRRSAQPDVVIPLVAFTTASGERVSFTAPPGKASTFYMTAPVKVIYHPDRPQEALIDDRARRWTRNGLSGGAALLLIALGGYVAWYASRWDKMSPAPAPPSR
jgi:hypothetical protein